MLRLAIARGVDLSQHGLWSGPCGSPDCSEKRKERAAGCWAGGNLGRSSHEYEPARVKLSLRKSSKLS